MGMHRFLRMRKLFTATISSDEFSCMTLKYKLYQVVAYINDNKSRKKCYVLHRILLPCIRVLRLDDSNIAGMENVYYYHII